MSEPYRRYIDLSHTIEDGLVTYKGLPAPVICDYLSREESRKIYEPGTEFQIGRIEMIANTGTYLDTPFHRYADGHDLSGIELEQVIDLPGVIVRVPFQERLAVTEADFEGADVAGRAVLVHTGWSAFWNTERYFSGHPFLTAEAARFLADAGARLVGIDSHNIDDSTGNRRPVHSILLGAGVLIVEHMCNLAEVPEATFHSQPCRRNSRESAPFRYGPLLQCREALGSAAGIFGTKCEPRHLNSAAIVR